MSAYSRPESLAEALALVASGHRVLAGGTDVYPGTGRSLAGSTVDITGLAELQGISLHGDLRIGAATTWTEIVETVLPPALAALQSAGRMVGGRQIQNAGTLGGNICNASPAADGIPPLLVLDAEVEMVAPGKQRRVPLRTWLKGPRRVDLAPGEIVSAIVIPESALRGRSAFLKLGARSHLVISIAMVAVRLVSTGDWVEGAAVAVGACSATAVRLFELEETLIGARLSDAVGLIKPHHFSDLTPIDDIRAPATYRTEAALELVRRAVMGLAA